VITWSVAQYHSVHAQATIYTGIYRFTGCTIYTGYRSPVYLASYIVKLEQQCKRACLLTTLLPSFSSGTACQVCQQKRSKVATKWLANQHLPSSKCVQGPEHSVDQCRGYAWSRLGGRGASSKHTPSDEDGQVLQAQPTAQEMQRAFSSLAGDGATCLMYALER